MSTAANFAFLGAFPFCPGSGSAYTAVSWATNISLADAMAFYWNLESVSLTTTGDFTWHTPSLSGGASIDGSITFSPLSTSGTWASLPNADWQTVSSTVLFPGVGSVPLGSTSSQPVSRVCYGADLDVLLLDNGGSVSSNNWTLQAGFTVPCVDPIHTGMYRIGFYISGNCGPGVGGVPGGLGVLSITSFSPSNSDYVSVGSGTFTIGPMSWEYYFGYSTNNVSGFTVDSISGGSVSGSRSDFTY